MTRKKKLLFLAGMFTVLGLCGCEEVKTECTPESFIPVCLDNATQLRCGVNGRLYYQKCADSCETTSTKSICHGENFCAQSCPEGLYCDYDQCVSRSKPHTSNCTVDGCPSGYTCNLSTNICDPIEITPETSCVKTGCPSSQVCNTNTGLCVPPPSESCTTTGCPSGEICDAVSGLCNASGEDCTVTGCPNGQTCNATTGKCDKPAIACDPACDPETEYCDTTVGECKTRPVIPPGVDAPDEIQCGTLEITDTANTCEKTGSGSTIILRGDVLGLDKTYKGGMVAIVDGKIDYVGCGDDYNTANATVITCPEAVITPGFINGHEHLTYSNGVPGKWGDERFDHRYDWRKGVNGHKKVPGPSTNDNEVVELRSIMGGTTSIFGSGSVSGLARNLDKQALDGVKSVYQTFPLGDSGDNENYITKSSCSDYKYHSSVTNFDDSCPYGPHIAEGINQGAVNELLCLNGQGIDGKGTDAKDIFKPNTAIIHGIAATPDIIDHMAQNHVKLIWSPRTNVSLYGDTAQAPLFDMLGVTVGLGTDWIYSGSANMLRELACVDYLNKNHYNSYFSDYQIWKMPTYNNAVAFGLENSIGQIKVGLHADLMIVKAYPTRTNHRAVIDAENKDITLVMIDGKFLYGDANIMDKGDAFDGCGVAKKVNVNANGGSYSLAAIEAANKYKLVFCKAEDLADEPTCVPKRTRKADTSDQQTTLYDASASAADDRDGDGIPDSADNCPDMFNPVRPQYTDRKQADYDNDGLGDICDFYPTCAANDDTCPKHVDPNDRDNDGIANLKDNCPNDANADQADADSDGIGDVCDTCDDRYDKDGDTIADNCDACPDDGNNEDGLGCSLQMTTIPAIRSAFIADTLPTGLIKTQGVVTAIANKFDGSSLTGFFIQDQTEPAGVFVYSSTEAAKVKAGDLVEVRGNLDPYFSLVEIKPTHVTVLSSGHTIAPKVLTAAETTADSNADGSKNVYDSVLVTVNALTVNSYDESIKNGASYVCTDANSTTAYIDDYVLGTEALNKLVEVGATYDVTGILVYDYQRSKIAPRSADDLFAGFGIKAINAPAAAEWNAPVEVTIQLNGEAPEDGAIALSYNTSDALPTSCEFKKGDAFCTVSSIVMPTSGSLVITAAYDGREVTTTIVGYDGSYLLAVGELEILTSESLGACPENAPCELPAGSKFQVRAALTRPNAQPTDLTIVADDAFFKDAPLNATIPAGDTEITFNMAVKSDVTPDTTATIGVELSSVYAESQTCSMKATIKATESKSEKITETFTGITSSNKTSYLDGTYTNEETGITWTYTKGRIGLDAYAIDGDGIMFNKSAKDGGTLETTLESGIASLTLQARKAFTKADKRSLKVSANGTELCTFELEDNETIQNMPPCQINLSGNVKLLIEQFGPQTTIDNIEWTTNP
ncbi:MAG: amidohydrolase family protein [Proteobacteria bacterium]|nr:amidohydrolase family protein [Pseudomonadota bacterium]